MTIDNTKIQFSLQLSSATTKDKAVYSSGRGMVMGVQLDFRHKHYSCAAGGIQGSQSPGSQPRSRCRREQPGASCRFQQFLLLSNISAVTRNVCFSVLASVLSRSYCDSKTFSI
jgi:hypothetical protein